MEKKRETWEYDSPAQIAECLQCRRRRCINCASPKYAAEKRRRARQKEAREHRNKV